MHIAHIHTNTHTHTHTHVVLDDTTIFCLYRVRRMTRYIYFNPSIITIILEISSNFPL